MAVAMFDTATYFGVLFGGHRAMLFQRVASLTESTRYGLVCCIVPVDDLSLNILAMLCIPGYTPLAVLASFAIPVPTPCPPVNPTGGNHKDVEEKTQKEASEMIVGSEWVSPMITLAMHPADQVRSTSIFAFVVMSPRPYWQRKW